MACRWTLSVKRAIVALILSEFGLSLVECSLESTSTTTRFPLTTFTTEGPTTTVTTTTETPSDITTETPDRTTEDPWLVGGKLTTTSATIYPITTFEPFTTEEDHTRDANCGGDPHFHTFHGEYFSFHGVCDLVLLRSALFGAGRGIEVHIRTQAREGYSSISNVALQIGNDVLEIANDGTHFVNGDSSVPFPLILSDGFVAEKMFNTEAKVFTADVSHGFTPTELEESVIYDVDLGGDEHIQIQRWRDYLWVNVRGGKANFQYAEGLMGSWSNPGRMARDGVTHIENWDEFGQEWQVLSHEATLFRTLQQPQHPQECLPPPPLTARRLGAETHAEAACAHVQGPMKESCVFDVMVTGLTEIAGLYGG